MPLIGMQVDLGDTLRNPNAFGCYRLSRYQRDIQNHCGPGRARVNETI